AVPPLFAEPPQTAGYAKFEKELQARQRKLTEFVQAKHTELVTAAKTRAAEYLLAAHALHGQPTTQDFMLIADTGDLNPRMLQRWVTYLQRTQKAPHPVWAPWHAFAALPEMPFAEKAATISEPLAIPDPTQPINPLVARSFAEKPPKTLAEAAQRYSE